MGCRTGIAAIAFMLAALSSAFPGEPASQTLAGTAGPEVSMLESLTPAPHHEGTLDWRVSKIRSIWETLHYTAPPLSETELQTILLTGNATAVDSGADGSDYFLSGAPTLGLSPTGMLLAGSKGRYWPHCTVVLTRPDTVITARHCIGTIPHPQDLLVFFPREGFRDAVHDGVSVFCTRDGDCAYRFDDLAAIRLAAPYSLIPVAHIANSRTQLKGTRTWAQGYGDSNLVLSDRGLLKSGPVDIAGCSCGHGDFENSGHICTPVNYEYSGHQAGYYAAYGGHSGGPLYRNEARDFELVGIASRLSRDCKSGNKHESRYIDLRQPQFQTWLSQVLHESPGRIEKPASAKELLSVAIGLSIAESLDEYPVQVPGSTARLLVTLNHELNGFNPEPGGNLDIELPENLEASCTRYYGVEACEVQNPPPGDYIIGIKAITGNPAYQLTAVAILE